MNKKENGSTSNNKHRAKKIIKLIIYIILLGLLAFISVKSCNLTLKALEPTATSWDDLNNVDIICNVNGNLSGELDPDEYYYLNNGNNTSGLAQTPAFQIYDAYTGLAYDEIRIRQTSIYLRGYLYDSQDNFSDYYDRQIWANDFIGENITPDTIRFENLSSDTPSNIPGANVYYPNVLSPFSAFLNIINLNFSYGDKKITIDTFALNDLNLDYSIYVDFYIFINDYEKAIKGVSYEITAENYERGFTYTDKKQTFINYSDLKTNGINTRWGFIINQDYEGYFTDFYLDIYTKNAQLIHSFSFNDTISIQDEEELYFDDMNNQEINNTCIINFAELENYKTENAYNIGYGAGYRLGRETGESVGYQDGYNDGYDDGASGTINTSWVLSLMNTATSILNIEIFPGFKLIYLVGAFIILMFVRFVIGWVR